MKCAKHLEIDAVGVCNHCGTSICTDCAVEQNHEFYCRECLAQKANPQKKEERSPALAAVLSFLISGLGQIYNGQIGKGLLIFFTSWLVIPWIIGIFDAYNSAKKINEGKLTAKSRPGCLIAFIVGMVIFMMGIFMIVLLAAIAIPNFIRARDNASHAASGTNTKIIPPGSY